MKTNLLIAAIALLTLTTVPISSTAASGDGITASPKLRQFLNEQGPAKPSAGKTNPTITVKTTAACSGTKVSASPKMLEQQPKLATQCCGTMSCAAVCARQ